MLPRPEFSQLYKFVAWFGIVLVLAAAGLPLLVTEQNSSLLVTKTELAQLTPQSAETIQHKQDTIAFAQQRWPIGSGGLAVVGMLALVWSLRKWKKRQDILDDTENLSRDKLRGEVLTQTVQEIRDRAAEAATERPESKAIPTGVQGGPASPGSARVLEIESTVFARLSEALAPAYLGQTKVKLIVGNKVIFLDALFRSLTGQHSDVIVELKYLSRSSGVRMRVSEAVSEVVRACTTYQAITGRPALGLVVVVLATGVPNPPGATSVEERFRDDAASRVMQPSLVVLREEELGSLQPEQLRARLPVDVQRGRTL